MKKIYAIALMALTGVTTVNAQDAKAFKLDKNYVITTAMKVADGQTVDDTHKGDEVSYEMLNKVTEAFLELENYTTFPIAFMNGNGGNYHTMRKDYTDPETGVSFKAGTYATLKGNDIKFYDGYFKKGLSNVKKVVVYLASQGRCKCVASILDESENRLCYQSEDTNNREIKQYYAPKFETTTWTEMFFDQPLKYVIDLTNAKGTEEEMTGSGMKMEAGGTTDIVTMLYQFYKKEADPAGEKSEIAGDAMPWTSATPFAVQFKQAAYIMAIAFICGDDNVPSKYIDITVENPQWSDNPTTGISSVMTGAAAGNGAIYNLAGQRISAPVKGGLYIQNGKKFIQK